MWSRDAASSNHRDTVDFDVERAGPRGHVEEDACRCIGRKESGVDFVECAEMAFAGRAIHIALDDALQRRSRSFKTLFHLLQYKLRLPFEWQAPDLAGVGFEGRQARHVDVFARDNNRIDRAFPSSLKIG